MGKRILIVGIVVLVIGGGSLMLALSLSQGGPRGLLAEVVAKESLAAQAYAQGFKDTNFAPANTLYKEAQVLILNLEEKYPDSEQTRSPELLAIKNRCRGRLASMSSPRETVEVMLDLMRSDAGRQYVEYWDFQALGARILPGTWETLSGTERDDVERMASEMVDQFIKSNQDDAVAKALKVSVREEEIKGDSAFVTVAFQISSLNLATEFTMELSHQSGVWKIFDFTSVLTSSRNGFTYYLKQAFDQVLKQKTIQDFLSSKTREEELARALEGAATEEVRGITGSMMGRKIKVREETKIMSGSEVLTTVAAEEVFEILRDQETPTGRWFLVSFVRPTTGKEEFGWIPESSVDILDAVATSPGQTPSSEPTPSP